MPPVRFPSDAWAKKFSKFGRQENPGGGAGTAGDNHATRHSDGGSDQVIVENLAATSTDTAKFLQPDGSGGVQVATPPGGGLTLVHITTNTTVGNGDHIIQIETDAVTATLPGSPVAGQAHTFKRKLVSGTPIAASGTAGNFRRNGVTVASYNLDSDEATFTVYWDSTHWMVQAMSGLIS